MGVRIDIKGKMNRNESYREKNRGPAYVPRFVTIYLTTNHQEYWPVTKMSKPYLHKKKKNTAGLVIVISVE